MSDFESTILQGVIFCCKKKRFKIQSLQKIVLSGNHVLTEFTR